MLYLLLLLITVISPWTYKIIGYNPILFFLLFALSFLILKSSAKSLIIIFILASILILRGGIDISLFNLSQEETFRINERRSYYSYNLGKLFQNKLIETAYKYQNNIFQNLDLNLYFFGTHPRERLGIIEFEKYHSFTLPFFLIGFFIAIFRKRLLIYFVLSLLTSSLSVITLNIGPVLLYPFINLCIVLGIKKVLEIKNEY